MNIQILEKRKKILTPLIIILLSAIISFYIQQSNFFYKGDELGNIAVFFFSFFILIIGTSFFFRESTIEIINVKMICGVILLIIDITLILTFLGTVILKQMSGPIITTILLFIFSLFNFVYLINSKFWSRQYFSKKYNILSYLNIFFIITIFQVFIANLNQSVDFRHLQDTEIVLFLIILLIPLINIIYATFLIWLHKKDKLQK